MLCIYNSKCTDFNNNGLVVLDSPITSNITEELNGQYELELEYPIDERGKWQDLIEGNIVKADGQLFRIYHKVKNLTSIKVNARHIFYDLSDNFIESLSLTNDTGSNALDSALSNTQYTHDFINMSDVGGSYTEDYTRKNPIEAIMGADGIINTWGGELVRDNFAISLLQARGLDRGVLVSYGKNIVGVEETLDTDGICTRLMPIGKDGLLVTEKYIDSQYINNFAHPKIKMIEFSDCEDEVTLRAAAMEYILDSKIDIPAFNYKIDFLELSKTEEYKNYALLESVYLGDTVTIKHYKLNINLKAKVIKITKNCITNRIEKVELGSFKPNIATGINKSIQAVQSEIVAAKSSLQLAIDNATTQINSALGGYVVKRNGELLIMDTEDFLTAVKVWRWNVSGLGYSGTGYNGPFATAITSDGHIVADFISTGTLDASKIAVLNLIAGRLMVRSGGITLLDGYNDTNGGVVKIYDISGNLDVKIGVESGTADNIGGTIVLYNDSISNPRVAIGIGKVYDAGGFNLTDTNGNNIVDLVADSYYGPYIAIKNNAGDLISYLTAYDGAIGGDMIATQEYVTSRGYAVGNFVSSNGAVGFFGKTPIAQKTASTLDAGATTGEIIAKINGILGILGQGNYNLISVS